MAYKIVKERRAWWPVKWSGVTEQGRVVENEIELRFIIHKEDEFVGLLSEAAQLPQKARDRLQGEADAEEERTALSVFYTDFLGKIAADWKGVLAENGEPLKFDPENIQLLMNEPGVFAAAVEAYRVCRTGGKDIRSGN